MTSDSLTPDSRRCIERVVAAAREVAETGARAALEALAVQQGEPYAHMPDRERSLRRRLRAHARQLGDRRDVESGGQAIERLVHECAYEHWHGMLFARFLAENNLLIHPEMGVGITLDECEELAKDAGSTGMDKWLLAARFAHAMLPQVFRANLPVFEVGLAQEHRQRLDALVEGLPEEVFTASDALGWVYQFWQSRKKAEVNRSEMKIGADELPAVTQLFTEPYMVSFLLDNSLGVRWAELDLQRSDFGSSHKPRLLAEDADHFSDWPDDLAALKVLDPCCGSGHFLVAAFLRLVPMRMAVEGLSAAEAVDAVLRDNIHGLELDQRCVAIAAFALALEAWRYPGAGGFRPLPRLRLAWCGQPVAGERALWVALAGGDVRRAAGMAALHGAFAKAPVLGSLVDPSQSAEDLLTADFADLRRLVKDALHRTEDNERLEELAVAAQGLTEAAELLTQRYHLILTNVPYLGREKQTVGLRDFCEAHYPLAKHDLATVFLERLLGLCDQGGKLLLVLPRNWLFLARYKALRKRLLAEHRWLFLATLGPGAFETISGEVVNTCLFCFWELPAGQEGWDFFQFAPTNTSRMTGCSHVIFWQEGNGKYADHAAALKREGRLGGWKSGHAAWGKRGIAVNRMGDLPASLYFGTKFDCNVAVLVPDDERDIAPLWAYCSSPQYSQAVRALNKKVSVTNGALAKVPYDAAFWERSASEDDVADLLAIHTDDPTQWGFHGHPRPATEPLQVAVARLLGYRWPAETATGLRLSSSAHRWREDVARCGPYADNDGIVCLPPLLGERPAHERLLDLLAACWGDAWAASVHEQLLAQTGAASLDDWLRRKFFAEHCKLFHNRPFVWHIWDGRADGFHALVNYHKAAAGGGKGRQLLEKLTYSYLGDWIARQRDAVGRDEAGADGRLAAALALQKTLADILEGEDPFDIFVRWKPVDQQAVGWTPDVNDGVRLNIRPFMAQDVAGGRRGAGVLRMKPNIHWKKDKGREPHRDELRFPWFWEGDSFAGTRVNDAHIGLAAKRHARAAAKAGGVSPSYLEERGAA